MKSLTRTAIALLLCVAAIAANAQTLTRSLMLKPYLSSFNTTIGVYTTPSAGNWTLSLPDSGQLVAGGPFMKISTAAGNKSVSFGKVNLGLAAEVSGILTVPNGGTGLSNIPAGNMLVGNGTGALNLVAGGSATGQVLTWDAVTGAPTWTTSIGGGGQTTNISNTGVNNTTNINNSSTGGTTNIGNSTSTTNMYGTVIFNTLPELPLTYHNMYVGNSSGYASELATVSDKVLTSPGGVPTWTTLLPIANGGTNSSTPPALGQVAYGDGSSYKFTSAGNTGEVLQYNSGSAPTWVPVSTLISSLAFQHTVTAPEAAAGVVTISGGGNLPTGYSATSKIIVTYQTSAGPAQAFTVSNQTATSFDVYSGAMNAGDKINYIIVP
ncbi:MAG: hypothetical protein JSS75_04205 [Bacteroidetes bacterium]|nr:hypothetical protein [Bacteroidota bacterium]